jgi:hypothetical protein
MSEAKLFLSFHFATDRTLASSIQQLAEAFGYKVVTGEDLGGGAVTPQALARIEACDAIVAVISRGERKPGKKAQYLARPWVVAELNHGRAKGKRNIALVDPAVKLEGPYLENERVPLDGADALPSLLKLARTLSLWRREMGRTLKAIILPEELAAQLNGDDIRCQYRFRHENWVGPFQEAYVHPEIGGTCAYLQGVKDEYLIEVRVRVGNDTWSSLSAPQWVRVELKKKGAA